MKSTVAESMMQPKGGMCCVCKHALENCSSLDFTSMPTIKRCADGTVIVRCTKFEKPE